VTIRRRVVVRGRVQGVFFRDSCRQRAIEHGVSGWVSNRDDGAVEAVFEGEPDAVEAMVGWSHQGPAQAQVSSVDVREEDPRSEHGFSVV